MGTIFVSDALVFGFTGSFRCSRWVFVVASSIWVIITIIKLPIK